jgi:hypothetical protein
MSKLIKKIRQHKYMLAITGVVVMLIIFGTVFHGKNLLGSVVESLNDSEYQIVQLDTGEIYLGKITETEDGFVVIDDVFYLFNESQKLVKQEGSDSLKVDSSRVLATEKLSKDSGILNAIENYKNKK